ncbi:MAG: hypothetical protein ACTSUE_15910 [Promethearchaeota archaeon]
MSKLAGVYDEHTKRSTIYINQKAYSFYVLWRCCFYQERTDFPKLCCSVGEIYATYYRIARMFDLVVETILPEQMLTFLQQFQHDGTLCIVEKQRTQKNEEFVPCCVISAKWAFWYQGLMSDSIAQGCRDIVLQHTDKRIVPHGKSIAQLNAEGISSLLKDGTTRRGAVLFSKRIGERSRVVNLPPPSEMYSNVVYDSTTEDITKEEEEESSQDSENTEEHMAIARMHHGSCEPNTLTKEQEDVYRYIHRLRTGQAHTMIPHRASSSMDRLGEAYISKSKDLDKQFTKKRRKRAQNKLKKRKDPNFAPTTHTVIISKHVARIHLRLQETVFKQEIEKAVLHTPEISEYVTLRQVATKSYPEDLKRSLNKDCPPKKKKKKKKESKRRQRKKKSKKAKKRGDKQDTAIREEIVIPEDGI